MRFDIWNLSLRSKAERGVTLIELIVAIVIVVFVIGAIGSVYYAATVFFGGIRAYNDVIDTARIVMLNLGNKIRFATGIVWEDGGRAIRIRIDPYYNSANPMEQPTEEVDDDVWVRYSWNPTAGRIEFDPDYDDASEVPRAVAWHITDFTIDAPSTHDNKGIVASVTVRDQQKEKDIILTDFFAFRYL